MALLFKPAMAQAILEGRKSVTRRKWAKPRVKVGAIHQAYTRPAFARPPGAPFARLRIVSVRQEQAPGDSIPLGSAMDREAICEGFLSWHAFEDAYASINGDDALDEPCWRVEFALVEKLTGEGR